MSWLTDEEKAEFIRRCKELALSKGERTNYLPARYQLAMWPGLMVTLTADSDHIHVRMQQENRKPENERWSMVFEQFKGQTKWGFINVAAIRSYLVRMREMMVLDDLAGI